MRSVNAADYQAVPRPVAVMPKGFAAGASTGHHHHARGQVLYATTGLMMARTADRTWAVPTGHALLIPPRRPHEVTMHGRVEMLTAYVSPAAWRQVARADCRVVRVSRLLDAALEALGGEPLLYDRRGRGGRLAAIVLDELARAESAELTLPVPAEPRLRAVCEALLRDPGLGHDLDGCAEIAAASRRTFTRLFRRETGLSFGEWRRRLRHIRSLELQAEGGAPKAIAARVGYRSARALAAMMKRQRNDPA